MVLFSAILTVGLFSSMIVAAPATVLHKRALPISISPSQAATYLNELTVEVPSNSPAYSRKLFKTWDIIEGKCNTRKVVLKRDGTNVVVNSECYPTSGSWVSPYDNLATDTPSSLDIDHLVPLKEAWISGARDWTPAQRESFANDLTRPQLVAITRRVNEVKGDSDPAKWLPSVDSFKCDYVVAFVQVKHYYKLSVDAAEKAAIASTLTNFC